MRTRSPAGHRRGPTGRHGHRHAVPVPYATSCSRSGRRNGPPPVRTRIGGGIAERRHAVDHVLDRRIRASAPSVPGRRGSTTRRAAGIHIRRSGRLSPSIPAYDGRPPAAISRVIRPPAAPRKPHARPWSQSRSPYDSAADVPQPVLARRFARSPQPAIVLAPLLHARRIEASEPASVTAELASIVRRDVSTANRFRSLLQHESNHAKAWRGVFTYEAIHNVGAHHQRHNDRVDRECPDAPVRQRDDAARAQMSGRRLRDDNAGDSVDRTWRWLAQPEQRHGPE